jgi:putative transposase
MARQLRVEYAGALYHVTARGNDRRPIFETNEDRKHLLELLAEGIERYEVRLYACVFLMNHYHLAVQTEHPNLHAFMHYLNTAYTVWTNKRNQRTGHLFEGRYKAIAMEEEGYLLSVTAYIHLNPVRMRGWRTRTVEDRLKRVETYPWSSYRAYTRAGVKDGSPGIACERVWGDLGARTEREGRKRYREYVLNWLVKEEQEKGTPASQRDDNELDPLRGVRLGCFLGGDQFRDFIQGLLGRENEIDQELVGHRQWRKELPIDDLLGQVAQVRKTTPEDLLTRRKPHMERDVAMYLCREVGQKPLREIAQRFGLKYSAVSVACKRVQDHASGDKRFAKRLMADKNAIIDILKT